LFEASKDQIIYDHNEHIDQDTHVSLVQSVSEMSSRNTGDFGLSGSLPFENSAFSGSTEYQTLAQKMDVYNSVNFYASIQRRYTTYSVSLSKGAKAKLTADFHDAVSSLPSAPQSDEEYDKWFDFFQKFGTHYVKEVSFGGVMRLTVFLRSTVEHTEEVKERNWDFDLEAIFNQHAGLNVSFGGDRTEKQLDSFSSYLMDEKFVAFGGDQSQTQYTKWLQTVKEKPAPIRTQLGSVEDFFPTSVQFRNILQKYFESCPRTDKLGLCNGYGVCNFSSHSCICNVEGAYKEDDGNCYPKCQDDCSNHGKCDNGKCKCDFDENLQMGFMTDPGSPPCSTPCGSKVYDAGDQAVWLIPDTNLKMGRTDGAPTCWCQKIVALDQMYGQEGRLLDDYDDTYDCDNQQQDCSVFWPWDSCRDYSSIICNHGRELKNCPENAERHPRSFHALTPQAAPVNQTNHSSTQKMMIA